jgi:hypothetical protein
MIFGFVYESNNELRMEWVFNIIIYRYYKYMYFEPPVDWSIIHSKNISNDLAVIAFYSINWAIMLLLFEQLK